MQVACPQCGAPVAALTETRFYRCSYCASPFVLNGDQGVEQYEIPHDRDDRIAWSALADHLERNGMETEIVRGRVDYLKAAFWCFTFENGLVRLEPAVTTLPDFIQGVTLPGGDLCYPANPELLPTPDLPMTVAEHALGEGSVKKKCLVYLPLYLLSYQWQGYPLTAAVSGIDRKVYAAELPCSKGIAISLLPATIWCGYILILIAEGLLIKDPWLRAAIFAVTGVVAYPCGVALLKKARP